MSRSVTRPNFMEIDLHALDQNYRLLLGLVRPGTRVIASVKGNAYGLGLEEIAGRLARLGVDALATGSYDDAMTIRAAGIETEIVMFGGALPEAMPDYVAARLTPTVHNMEIARAVSAAARGTQDVYVKVDCGWGRLGVPVMRARPFVRAVAELPHLRVAGLYTHLPFSDAEGREWAGERLQLFDTLVDELARDGIHVPVTQARSTAGILAGLDDRCTAVSPGGLLYGRSPLVPGLPVVTGLRPVLKSIRTRLIHVAPDAADRTPGSHGRYAFKVTGATGVVPFGRADGNRAPVAGRAAHMLIRGCKAPVLGVSSEHCVIDLSAVPDPEVGEEVFILGRSGDETVELGDLAAAQATTMSDVMLMMSGRMQRVFIEAQSA